MELLEKERELIVKLQEERQKASVDPSYQVDIDFPTEKTKLYTEALEKGAITQDEFNYAMEHLAANWIHVWMVLMEEQ